MEGFTVAAGIGLALGFMFGVGCAAAVLYSIYRAGFRAGMREAKGAAAERETMD